jgi:hypothetical protein
MHCIANVLRNFIKMLKGQRSPGQSGKAPSGADQEAADAMAMLVLKSWCAAHGDPPPSGTPSLLHRHHRGGSLRRKGRRNGPAMTTRIASRAELQPSWFTGAGLLRPASKLDVMHAWSTFLALQSASSALGSRSPGQVATGRRAYARTR